MHKIALIYGSTEGHTRTVAEHISAILSQDANASVDVFHGKEMSPTVDLEAYDAIMIGASIHVSKHQPYIIDLVKRHADLLRDKPTAFFSVSLSAAEDQLESKQIAQKFVDDFVEETGWHPDLISLFPGALAYTTYGFLKRLFMRHLTKKKGGTDTDTSRDYVYTDWEDVEDFARTFLKVLSPDPQAETGEGRPFAP